MCRDVFHSGICNVTEMLYLWGSECCSVYLFVNRLIVQRLGALERGGGQRMQHSRRSMGCVTAAVAMAACGVLFPAVVRAVSAGDSHSCAVLDGGGSIKVRLLVLGTPPKGEVWWARTRFPRDPC